MNSTMTSSKIASFFMNLLNSVKSENLRWQQEKQQQIFSLKRSKEREKHTLQAELEKQKAEFSFHLTKMKQQHEASLTMFKAECEQQIRDYKQYLDSIDQLKTLIQKSYSHLPDAVSLTIHHHAKQILKQMWQCQDIEKKLQHETRLIELMTTVHQDTLESADQSHSVTQLPKRTLELIKLPQSNDH